jgi:uncharacterized protein
MSNLLVVGLAGFSASLVDGALGMGFGPTSSTILLSTGMPAKAVSTTVNIAKVATGLAAGVSHWRFGNIDRRIVAKLAIPGCFGALVGVTLLSNLDDKKLKPILAALLLVVGLRILFRFSKALGTSQTIDAASGEQYETRGIVVAGAAGGVTNGLIGAWGPVVTPFLMHKRVPPRIVIGSVNTAEVFVAFVAAGSLIASLGKGTLDIGTVVAMLIGGVLAAPIAAWVIRFLPARGLGVAVAGLLLFTNARELATWADLAGVRWLIYAAIACAVAAAGFAPRLAGSPEATAVGDGEAASLDMASPVNAHAKE